jgi:hypothetical protein
VPRIQTFELDSSIVAPRIYGTYPHEVTSIGLSIEQDIKEELSRFLEEYLRFLEADAHIFMRVDAFIERDKLNIIEINIECQEGWGIALNLLRASGNTSSLKNTRLPAEIIQYASDYRPEFELAQKECALLGHDMHIVNWKERPGILARSIFDSKIYLARFAQIWKGKKIHVPNIYLAETVPWEKIPTEVVFKFCEKYGVPACKAKYSVTTRRDIGKGKFMRKCYGEGNAIAQERIAPFQLSDGSVTQAIIMCAGSAPVTGYLQVAPACEFIINDKTARKGPLVFE